MDPFIDWTGVVPARPGIDVPELLGYGAIAPEIVRALVASASPVDPVDPVASTSSRPPPGHSWLRIEEPVTPETPVPPPAPGYHPTAELDRYVRRRDLTCQAPGCPATAYQGDLDHAIRHPEGKTTAGNLQALCRRHHLLKTHAGHTLTRQADGSITWQTPAGQALRSTVAGDITRARFGSQPEPRRVMTVNPDGDNPSPAAVRLMFAFHDAYDEGRPPEDDWEPENWEPENGDPYHSPVSVDPRLIGPRMGGPRRTSSP